MSNLANIIARAYDKPLLMDPSRAEVFFAYLSHRIKADELVSLETQMNRADMQKKIDSFKKKELHVLGESQYFEDDVQREYAVVNNIAVINVMGTLVNRSDWMDVMSGMTGYNHIASQVNAANADPMVGGIFFHADSGGGEVAGCFDCADIIAKSEKPTAWFADEMSCSAAYALACGADAIYAPRTADIGSIGVLVAHQDISEQMKDAGVKITLIHSGAFKVDGNPYQALPEAVQERWQADIDDVRNMFAGEVAKHRGLTIDSVLATEAAVYNGARALEMGLIDGVLSRDEAFQTFSASISENPRGIAPAQSSTPDTQEHDMSETQEITDGQSLLAAVGDAVTAEQTRIFAVLELPEAKAHMGTAIKLAKQGLNAESALDILESLPEPQAQAPDVHAQALAAMQDHAELEQEAPAPVAKAAPTNYMV